MKAHIVPELVMKRDPRVNAYIERAQPFARPIPQHVRERVHTVCPDAEETLKWSPPSFTLGGKILLLLAAFRQHAALNFCHDQELRDESADSEAMGQFGKITSVDDLPPDEVLDAIIQKAAELARSGFAPRKGKHTLKPPSQLHPDFAVALEKAPRAKSILQNFPASAQRDYVNWIAEAKQYSTRQKRIATAIEWLSEGKRRNWKYERC
jgi:uncharacterized protein YdeI (YjbR/CyaY-like superfamily)